MDNDSKLFDLVGQGIYNFIAAMDNPDSKYTDPNRNAIETECVDEGFQDEHPVPIP